MKLSKQKKFFIAFAGTLLIFVFLMYYFTYYQKRMAVKKCEDDAMKMVITDTTIDNYTRNQSQIKAQEFFSQCLIDLGENPAPLFFVS